MLIDYISPEKLPQLIVWLDDKFYFYRESLIMFMLVSFTLYFLEGEMDDWTLPLFVGFCMWVSYCAVRYGRAVG
jgi:hypothetical protein